MKQVKTLKIISFIIGFCILFALIMALGTIAKKVKDHNRTKNQIINLEQKTGSSIKNILIKDKYLYIIVSNIDKEDKIIVLDKENYETISTINLK